MSEKAINYLLISEKISLNQRLGDYNHGLDAVFLAFLRGMEYNLQKEKWRSYYGKDHKLYH
jgi:hypothetical protein